jgi:hypothetical protein
MLLKTYFQSWFFRGIEKSSLQQLLILTPTNVLALKKRLMCGKIRLEGDFQSAWGATSPNISLP